MPKGLSLLLQLVCTSAAAVQTCLAQQNLETEYIMPAARIGNEHRQHCQGFSQLEPLKGEWIDHHDPFYMGMTAGKPCPSFINDFDCLKNFKSDAYYEELGRRVGCFPWIHTLNERLTPSADSITTACDEPQLSAAYTGVLAPA